jgi:hypothetical protein
MMRISGRMREEVREGGRKLHNEELHNLYLSPNIIRVMKSSKMRLVGHVARMVEASSSHSLSNSFTNELTYRPTENNL